MAPKSPFNPLDTIALQSPTLSTHSVEFSPKVGPSRDPEAPVKRWYHYLPLCGAVLLILAPQPSWLYVLLDYHLKTIHRPGVFLTHLLVSYTLTFLIFSALIVCVARDPGPVMLDEPGASQNGVGADDAESETLMNSSPLDDYSAPGRWCRKCWGPKPERAHHCSICGRCVLKMDHHCPWLGAKCIGHRTYPAFLHFLLCITLLSIYIATVCSTAVWHAFEDPLHMNELMPLHAIFLTFYAVVFTLVMGSFYCYHLYLVFINQTTIENLSPFLILRHLPPLPPSPPSPSATAPPYHHTLSSPPLEPELSRAQRRLVQDAHGHIRIYDLGWRRNFAQVFGFGEGRGRGARGRGGWRDERGEGGGGGRWRNWKGWVGRVWFGGSAPGDGRTFPRNPRSEELLARLANELVKGEYR